VRVVNHNTRDRKFPHRTAATLPPARRPSVAFNVALTIATAHTRSRNDRDTRRNDLCNRVSRMLSATARSTDNEARDSCRPSRS
jgi:hypothetical protein